MSTDNICISDELRTSLIEKGLDVDRFGSGIILKSDQLDKGIYTEQKTLLLSDIVRIFTGSSLSVTTFPTDEGVKLLVREIPTGGLPRERFHMLTKVTHTEVEDWGKCLLIAVESNYINNIFLCQQEKKS